MIVAASHVVAGTLSVGDIVLVNAFILQLYQPLNFLGVFYRELRQSLTDLENIHGLFALQPEIADAPDAQAARGRRAARVRFEDVVLRLRPAPADPQGRQLRDPGRAQGGGGRPVGLGQVDAGPAAVPLLRGRRRRRIASTARTSAT